MAFLPRPSCLLSAAATAKASASRHLINVPTQRYASSASAVAATMRNIPWLIPEQLQYGKPSPPSPPSTHKRLDQIHANLPTYPHPRKYWYKKSNLGLYGNLSIRHGKRVSVKNKHKNPRVWRPNVQGKRLWSVCLERFVRVKVVARVIRTIDKVGGLDNYLLGNSKGRIRELGMGGWALRWRIARSIKGRERIMQERKELGLEGEPAWMGLPFAVKWLATWERKNNPKLMLSTKLNHKEELNRPIAGAGLMTKSPVVADEAITQQQQAGKDESSAEAAASAVMAAELEKRIDAEFDADDEAAARGDVERGIELEDAADEKEDEKGNSRNRQK